MNAEAHRSEPGTHQPRAARRDFVIVVAFALAAFLGAIWLELAERIQLWTRLHERWQLDEALLALFALVVALAWFAWRRLREARAQAVARMAAEGRTAALLEENRALAQRIIEVQEEERRNIARELHDELGQCCNAIKLDAVAIDRQLCDQPAALRTSLQAIIATAGGMHDIVRGMLHRLRPAALDDLGLTACIQDMAETWEQRHGVACVFLPDGPIDDLPEPVKIAVYRIVQECLTNVSRHAAAEQATIKIERNVPDVVDLSIEDNGRGLADDAPRSGYGIAGMIERVRGLGGNLQIAPRPGGGVRVHARLPVGSR